MMGAPLAIKKRTGETIGGSPGRFLLALKIGRNHSSWGLSPARLASLSHAWRYRLLARD